MLACFFYDDQVGFEVKGLGGGSHSLVKDVHRWLGVLFEDKKLQMGTKVEILGILYDFEELVLRVKEKRRVGLIEDINRFLLEDAMSPQEAAKLKGKLMFAASQFWGRLGRAFLLALSERQKASPDKLQLTLPVQLALLQWRLVLAERKPRPLAPPASTDVEVVIFTDGFYPDPRFKETGVPGIGGVCCEKGRQPLYFAERVAEAEMAVWSQRVTQIISVEMLAAVRALQAFTDRVGDKRVILLIDSEAVEGALVEGYSGREDLCQLVGVFWSLVRFLQCELYLDRVLTDSNLADTPSRGSST